MFKQSEVDDLLSKCHRRCCICHRFCGIKIELDHIEQRADSHDDSIENAIPVCFDCHAEIHSYNDRHPRGRKFRSSELRSHKAQWLDICAKSPTVLIEAFRRADVGPIQAMIDELQFNLHIATAAKLSFDQNDSDVPALFMDEQFRLAVRSGSIAILADALRKPINDAYRSISQANLLTMRIPSHNFSQYSMQNLRDLSKEGNSQALKAEPAIRLAHDCLLRFLAPEGAGEHK